MILTLEQQVCTLESAKRLKELGVIQDSYFNWTEYSFSSKGHKKWWSLEEASGVYVHDQISAFTASELGELLPTNIDYAGESFLLTINHWNNNNEWQVSYLGGIYNDEEFEQIFSEPTMVEALAKMLIYLTEAGLVKPTVGEE